MWLWVIICLCWGHEALAANPFQMGKVDYFDHASLKKAEAKKQKSLDWREPIIGQDGRVTYYQPPAPLLALLKNPTQANAKTYLEWQKQKNARIFKAQQAIDAVAAKEKM